MIYKTLGVSSGYANVREGRLAKDQKRQKDTEPQRFKVECNKKSGWENATKHKRESEGPTMATFGAKKKRRIRSAGTLRTKNRPASNKETLQNIIHRKWEP